RASGGLLPCGVRMAWDDQENENKNMRSRVPAIVWGLIAAAVVIAILVLASSVLSPSRAEDQQPDVDTALIVSVDVFNSVDVLLFKLQLVGIAKALVFPEVLKSILIGPQGGILFFMVTWADKPKLSFPWQRISSAA